MIKTSSPPLTRRLLAVLAILALSATALRAEDVFVTTYKGTTSGTTDNVGAPLCTYTGTVSGSGTSAYSTATPTPPISPRRSRFGFSSGASWSVTPTDTDLFAASAPTVPIHYSSLKHVPGLYAIYVTKPTSGSDPTNITVDMTATEGGVPVTLGTTGGVAAASIPLHCFRNSSPVSTWVHVGFITNTAANPTVTFTHASGGFSRYYMDAVRFEYVDPCTWPVTVAPQPGVAGPLAAGQQFVNITGVAAGATNVVAFANGLEIGQTNYAGGFAAGTVQVPTSALVKDAVIAATQTKTNLQGGACSSTLPSTGPIVGGGANPQVRALISCYKQPDLPGPVGTNATGGLTNFPYFLSATAFSGGFNTAPLGGRQLLPSQCWQTITFNHLTDDAIDSNAGGHVTNSDTFCALEALLFAIDTTDSGPYDIYIDEIKNGNTVIESFETYTDGATATFNTPNTSAAPNAGATYLSAPNSSAISANYAFEGTKSCRLQWQWKDTGNIRWAKIRANASAGLNFPMLNVSQPITIRVLVMPVAQTTAFQFNGTVGAITNSGIPYATLTNILSVPVTGSGTYTYTWTRLNGMPVYANPNGTLTIGDFFGISDIDADTYTVVVSDGNCSETRSYNFVVNPPLPFITTQPTHAVVNIGAATTPISVSAAAPVAGGYPLSYQWRLNGTDIAGQNAATLSIPAGAALTDVGAYEVVVANTYGSVTSVVAYLDVVPVGVAIGTGTGLRGDYYGTHFYTNYVPFVGAPTFTRVDRAVDFSWATGASPDPSIPENYFTARWFGQVQALDTDTYTFATISDDGVRLWVNGQLMVDNWTTHPPQTNSAALALTAGQKYDVVMEYFEGGVSATAQLWWSNATSTVQWSPIPMSQLSPGTTFVLPTCTLTAPADLTTNTLPATVNLAATITAGSAPEITEVQFLTNGVLLAAVPTAPYTYNWVNPPADVYAVTARVIYDKSSAAASAVTHTLVINQVIPVPVTSVGIAAGAPGTLNITYAGGTASSFVLVKSADVTAPIASWTTVTSTNGTTPATFSIPIGAEAQMFYRIVSQ